MQAESPPPIVFDVDKILTAAGHVVLRTPPYYPEFQPIEQLWWDIKRKVMESNDFTVKNMAVNIYNAVSAITPDRWAGAVRHATRQIERAVEQERESGVQRHLLVVVGDSDNDEDSKDEDE